MLELLQFLGFTLLFIRFSYWVGASLLVIDKKWKRVVVAQATEGFLLFFFFSQLVGAKVVLPFPQSPVISSIGFFLTLIGVAICFVAKYQLGAAWVYASVYRIVANQSLIRKGLYAYIRHPMYTGIVLSYVGIELLAGSWLFVSALFLFFPFYNQARKEEQLLAKHYGKQYYQYQEHTKMFIPFIF